MVATVAAVVGDPRPTHGVDVTGEALERGIARWKRIASISLASLATLPRAQ